jgi:hypothetical protein
VCQTFGFILPREAEFEHAGILEEVGATAYLTQLLTAMVGTSTPADTDAPSSTPGCAAS